MALTRRHPLPPEGLGRSRFAVLHHNAIRQGLRANNSSATGVLTKARRGSGTDEVVKALGARRLGAQQLQARCDASRCDGSSSWTTAASIPPPQ